MNDALAYTMIGVATVLIPLTHLPTLLYKIKKLWKGKNSVRLWYFNEAGRLETDVVHIGTVEAEKEIVFRKKSFLFDPKKTFYFPKMSGLYSGELCIMYVHNSCNPVDVHEIFTGNNVQTPDELSHVLRSKIIKEFMTPTDLVKGAISIGVFILGAVVLYVVAAKMGWV